MKKSMNVILYDDVLGSSNITVLSKYCSSCKLTYYPGYFESFKEKKKIYYTEWTAYGVFISTYCSAFSVDLLDQLICMKQKCHTTFMGKSQAYNLYHNYATGEEKSLDKRRLFFTNKDIICRRILMEASLKLYSQISLCYTKSFCPNMDHTNAMLMVVKIVSRYRISKLAYICSFLAFYTCFFYEKTIHEKIWVQCSKYQENIRANLNFLRNYFPLFVHFLAILTHFCKISTNFGENKKLLRNFLNHLCWVPSTLVPPN